MMTINLTINVQAVPCRAAGERMEGERIAVGGERSAFACWDADGGPDPPPSSISCGCKRVCSSSG